jgi:hypothetical protein
LAKSSLRFIVFAGPGGVGVMKAALAGRQWSILFNCTQSEAEKSWPATQAVWKKRRIDAFDLTRRDLAEAEDDGEPDAEISGPEWSGVISHDERRPGRRSVIIESPDAVVGINPTPNQSEPPVGRPRVAVLDACWTHVQRFPDREEVRECFEEVLGRRWRHVFYVTNLPWDARFFEQTVRDLQLEGHAEVMQVDGWGQRLLWQVRELLPRIADGDLVMLALVPGRDERGAFQRLRSDFAERTQHVSVYPVQPLSTGPGPSREEALEAVGIWLPTQVLIAAGPLSEQVLLARYLSENAGGTAPVVGTAGTEYRMPTLNVARQYDVPSTSSDRGTERVRTARSGLVIATYGREDRILLAGSGLASEAQKLLTSLHINRRGKPAERIVHDIENAFSSRGLPVPAVRFLT